MSGNRDKIIKILSKSDRFVTADELAKSIGISTKTIYRTVNGINDHYGEQIIVSERGKGLKLNYDRYLELTRQTSSETDKLESTPLERRNQILAKLLFNAPLANRVSELYEDFFVSTELIQQDLTIISKQLQKYDLSLKRDGSFVSVVGDERNIRRAINAVLIQSNAMNQESINDFVSEFHDLSRFDNQFITAQLELIQRLLNTTIPYPYNVNIFSHLYILMKRIRQGKMIDSKDGQIKSKRYEKIIQDNPKFYKVSNDVIKNVADYLNCDIPAIESYYLLEYLISMRYNNNFIYDKKTSSESMELAEFYIKYFGLNPSSSRVISLQNDLVSHIRPMINRLNNHIIVANKVLADIKLEYGQLFKKVAAISEKAENQLQLPWKINDDEIGFLTLYFAKYIEESSLPKRVLIMCASGIGTSKLLYVKIHKAFPDLNIVGVTSKTDYVENPDKYDDVDVIVSTVPVVPRKDAKVILSSAMFNEQDRNRLSRLLNDED